MIHSTATIKEQTQERAATLRLPNVEKAVHSCRFCRSKDLHTFLDLGLSPLCESFVSEVELDEEEKFYPLHALVCRDCFLVQVPEYVSGEEIFGGEYAYFSSYSDSWLKHIEKYSEAIIDRLGLTSESQVVEIASNDGYLLKNFVSQGIPSLGIEPADNVAEVAQSQGIDTIVKFFGVETAKELVADGIQADLLCANNVIAHVPEVNDFVGGMKIVLAKHGVITVEFPHLMRLIEGNQFDTIYQEHYYYYSLHTLLQIFAAHGMTIFDVEELSTHGGSLRIYARHTEDKSRPVSAAVSHIHAQELNAGYSRLETYRNFSEQVAETKRKLLEFLIQAKRAGKSVAGYGAPGKGNTLLNYCGIRTDFIDYVVDRNPYKHGKYLPGSRIPVFPTDRIEQTQPDYILILPWNLKDEIMKQLEHARDWGCQFVVPIPEVTLY